jgi:hypothetical protein
MKLTEEIIKYVVALVDRELRSRMRMQVRAEAQREVHRAAALRAWETRRKNKLLKEANNVKQG